MNAIQLLKKDHRTVEALFKRFEKTGDDAHALRRELADKIVKELSIHAAIEEQLLYPAARARSEKLDDLVLEALEEHHIAKWTLREIERMSPKDERFEAKVTVLMESIRHHVEEEQEELFPRLEKVMSKAELNALGAAMAQAKTVAPTHPHPMSPDTPPGNVIAAALAKVLDTGRDLVRTVTRKTQRAAAKTARRAGATAKQRAARRA